jgi:hypothetical protein
MLQKKCGMDCINMTTANKAVKLCSHREKEYKLLTNATYERRGWTRNCAPTMTKSKHSVQFGFISLLHFSRSMKELLENPDAVSADL